MSKPQARLTDLCQCMLFAPSPAGPIPGVSPLAFVGAPTVLVGNLPAARMGDNHVGMGPHPVAMGSVTVLIQNQPAARMADPTACGGMVMPPCLPTVLTGG